MQFQTSGARFPDYHSSRAPSFMYKYRLSIQPRKSNLQQ